jgi:hypothetical protein
MEAAMAAMATAHELERAAADGVLQGAFPLGQPAAAAAAGGQVSLPQSPAQPAAGGQGNPPSPPAQPAAGRQGNPSPAVLRAAGVGLPLAPGAKQGQQVLCLQLRLALSCANFCAHVADGKTDDRGRVRALRLCMQLHLRLQPLAQGACCSRSGVDQRALQDNLLPYEQFGIYIPSEDAVCRVGVCLQQRNPRSDHTYIPLEETSELESRGFKSACASLHVPSRVASAMLDAWRIMGCKNAGSWAQLRAQAELRCPPPGAACLEGPLLEGCAP